MLASTVGAPQHGPRPLPLFLALLAQIAQHDPVLGQAAMAGLARYQSASRAPPPKPRRIVAHAGRAVLRDYGGDGPPVVLVPSLINPPTILDLMPRRSFAQWLARQGFRPLLVDWGDASSDDPDLAGHAELIATLIASLDQPPHLIGYCLGGTLAMGVASVCPVRSLTLIAAPWRFSNLDVDARSAVDQLWTSAQPVVENLGVMPMEVMQAGFWQIDPARTVSKFAAFAPLSDEDPAAALFVALEDWANSGAPLPRAAARDLFEGCYHDDMTGSGGWAVGGQRIDPSTLNCPVLDIISSSDRIVPAEIASGLPNRLLISQGHVGMMIGSQARQKLWRPVVDWIRAPP